MPVQSRNEAVAGAPWIGTGGMQTAAAGRKTAEVDVAFRICGGRPGPFVAVVAQFAPPQKPAVSPHRRDPGGHRTVEILPAITADVSDAVPGRGARIVPERHATPGLDQQRVGCARGAFEAASEHLVDAAVGTHAPDLFQILGAQLDQVRRRRLADAALAAEIQVTGTVGGHAGGHAPDRRVRIAIVERRFVQPGQRAVHGIDCIQPGPVRGAGDAARIAHCTQRRGHVQGAVGDDEIGRRIAGDPRAVTQRGGADATLPDRGAIGREARRVQHAVAGDSGQPVRGGCDQVGVAVRTGCDRLRAR